jgi:hypothetical protein
MMKVDEMKLDADTIFWGKHYELFVLWHPTMKCPECGDEMYCADIGDLTKEEDKQWLCRSNLYMEGGC